MRSPPGTSPTPERPALSCRMTMLRVKKGACAPLRLRSMLSCPATGMTCMPVPAGVPGTLTSAPGCSSGLRGDGGDQRLDVAERVHEARHGIDALDARHVVRHHHAVVPDLLVDAHRFQHVDAAVVDERLAEVEKPSLDVAEVHAEVFAARAEVADHVEDLLPRLVELLRDRALAEIQAVVRAFLDRHELLQPFG